jgi:1-acyl-sn-glycerol-3-phosphate acyltransferase
MTVSSQNSEAAGAEGLSSAMPPRGHAVDRIFRMTSTALSFSLAGIMFLFLGLVFLPLLRLSSADVEVKELRAQRAMHEFARAFVRTTLLLRLMRLDKAGTDRLREPGILVVANHPTLFDAVVLISLMPQADCVFKAGHYRNAFLAAAIRGAGYIPNLDGAYLTEECARRIGRGRSVLIFPEGTRSPVGGLGTFARGASHIALRASCDPVPVTIKCEPATLYRGSAWWNVPERKVTLALSVDEPFVVKDALGPDLPEGPAARPRRARALTRSLQNYFERRLSIV